MEKIKGVIQYVLYSSEEYSIVKFVQDNGVHTTVIGNIPDIKNVPITCHGTWFYDKKYGREFKSERYEIEKPKDKKGVISYMISLHCGIGKVWATRIYEKFGESTWDILSKSPEKLLEIEGFKEKRLDALLSKLDETENVRKVMAIFTDKINIGLSKAELIVKSFGNKATDIIQNDTYQLITIHGLGFKTVDEIGKEFKADLNNSLRIQGCLFYLLDMFETKGHSCVLQDTLIDYMHRVLNKNCDSEVVTKERCVSTINYCINHKYIYAETYNKDDKIKNLIFRANSYFAEDSIARNLLRIHSGNKIPFDKKTIDDAIEEFSSLNKFKLAYEQKKAIKIALTNPISILTGGPGTGKTTIIKAVLYIYKKLCYDINEIPKPVLLAPTGRASRRLAESTGCEACTIHSKIGFVPNDEGIGYASNDHIEGNLIIVDEMSMTDQYIMKLLLETISDNARVVFIGDTYQLPSVGSGNVLSDMIQSDKIPIVKLQVIFRQGGDSPIVKNSQKILKGEKKLDLSKGFYCKETNNDKKILVEACRFYVNCVNKFGIDNVVLLTPFREKTEISVNSFNTQLQHYYNPPEKLKDKPTMKIHNTEFREGDRIMQTKNTENALNGDIGYIHSIAYAFEPRNEDRFTIVCNVEFNNSGEILQYTQDDMKNVQLAYAMTVHKSQGSEYKVVIFVASMSHQIALKRNLLYTAITRASENVAIIGQQEALDYAIDNRDASNRVTFLRNRIRKLFENKKEVLVKKEDKMDDKKYTGTQLSLVS